MNTKYIVRLSPAERQRLETRIHSGSALARVQTKARILLLTDYSQDTRMTDAQIIRGLSTSNSTIQRVRIQFVEGGIDAALFDKPRSGCPPKITGDIEAKLTMLACSDPPEGHARWTLQLLADQMIALGYIDTISDVAVYKRLKKRSQTLAR